MDAASERPLRSALLVAWLGLLLGGVLPPGRLLTTQEELSRPGLVTQRWSPYTARIPDHWVLRDMPRGQALDRETREIGVELAVITGNLAPSAGVVELRGTRGMLLCDRRLTLVRAAGTRSQSTAVEQQVQVSC